jgi:hypothetical protein
MNGRKKAQEAQKRRAWKREPRLASPLFLGAFSRSFTLAEKRRIGRLLFCAFCAFLRPFRFSL